MRAVATLLKQVPAKCKSRLQALEKELSVLRTENARLEQALAQTIEQWETLDGPQVSVLIYLSQPEHAHAAAAEIARSIETHIQIVESSLVFLLKTQYLKPFAGSKGAAMPGRGKRQHFCLAAKGTRYLSGRGLHK